MRSRYEAGFSVLQLTMLVAMVAIFAAAAMPLGIRALELAEEQEGYEQLERLEAALLAFQRDHGRLPTSNEGLEALVRDPGSARWNGPYLKGAVDDQAFLDPRGVPVIYKRLGAAASLRLGGFDDLQREIITAPVHDGWSLRADEELKQIALACREFQARYQQPPAGIGALVPDFLGADYALDPWGQPYRIEAASRTAASNGVDGEAQTADDIVRSLDPS